MPAPRISLPPLRRRVGRPSGRVGSGEHGFRKGLAQRAGNSLFCTVAPLSRPLLTQGPPSPAEGGCASVPDHHFFRASNDPERDLEIHWSVRERGLCLGQKALNTLTSRRVNIA